MNLCECLPTNLVNQCFTQFTHNKYTIATTTKLRLMSWNTFSAQRQQKIEFSVGGISNELFRLPTTVFIIYELSADYLIFIIIALYLDSETLFRTRVWDHSQIRCDGNKTDII